MDEIVSINDYQAYFEFFRNNMIGNGAVYRSILGKKSVVYADWMASGRLYGPIEDKLKNEIGPFIANPYPRRGSNEFGTRMFQVYKYAQETIKKHVNASPTDVIITQDSGMTGVFRKFQRLLGFTVSGQFHKNQCNPFTSEEDRPVVFITHMEHHSNHTSWYETFCDVELLTPDKNLLVDLDELRDKVKKYKNRRIKIGSFTACSNVTGIGTPYSEMAKIMHEADGVCFVDFCSSAPYDSIDMHPPDPLRKLDAIIFSPHKFLGGPGSTGVLIFDPMLFKNRKIVGFEERGTPGILQTVKGALAIQLKEKMGTSNIDAREKELVKLGFHEFRKIPEVHLLADNVENRKSCFSFFISDIHYNLVSKILSDRFGIQVRGGCSCAGTYGHYLLDIDYKSSRSIARKIDQGDFSTKPGWIRVSLHPVTTNEELLYIIDAIKQISIKGKKWGKDYIYSLRTNEFHHKKFKHDKREIIMDWF